jgi:hypothetical protein
MLQEGIGNADASVAEQVNRLAWALRPAVLMRDLL